MAISNEWFPNNTGYPKPPPWVGRSKWDVWYEYWRKIYLDAEDTEREIAYNERMMNGAGSRSEVEAD